MGDESATEFGRRCGVGEATLRNIIKSGAWPRTDNLVAIADAANVNIEWLAAGRGPKERGGIVYGFDPSTTGDIGFSATPKVKHDLVVLNEAHRSSQDISVAHDSHRPPEISKFLMRVTMASSRATWLPTNMDDEDRMAIANTAVQMLIPIIKDSHAILLGIMDRPAIIDLALRLAFELHTHVVPKT